MTPNAVNSSFNVHLHILNCVHGKIVLCSTVVGFCILKKISVIKKKWFTYKFSIVRRLFTFNSSVWIPALVLVVIFKKIQKSKNMTNSKSSTFICFSRILFRSVLTIKSLIIFTCIIKFSTYQIKNMVCLNLELFKQFLVTLQAPLMFYIFPSQTELFQEMSAFLLYCI